MRASSATTVPNPSSLSVSLIRISDTESELGLGTVVALDARMVTLLFPAIGENRLYSRNDSPITRVMFNPGIVARVQTVFADGGEKESDHARIQRYHRP